MPMSPRNAQSSQMDDEFGDKRPMLIFSVGRFAFNPTPTLPSPKWESIIWGREKEIMMKKFGWILLFVLIVAAVFAVPVLAQGGIPPEVIVEEPSPPASTNPSLPDVAILIAIVAFFKKRFGLSEYGVIYTVVIVGAILWFSPLLATIFPEAGTWIDQIFAFVKWVLASMGAVDFAINTGAKIVTTTKKELEAEVK